MQLVQDGKIKLDDPVSKYGINLESEGVIRVNICSRTPLKAFRESTIVTTEIVLRSSTRSCNARAANRLVNF